MALTSMKQTYSETFLKWGFTSIIDKGIEKPQCVLCEKVLTAESMKPSKLQSHLSKVHPNSANEDVE